MSLFFSFSLSLFVSFSSSFFSFFFSPLSWLPQGLWWHERLLDLLAGRAQELRLSLSLVLGSLAQLATGGPFPAKGARGWDLGHFMLFWSMVGQTVRALCPRITDVLPADVPAALYELVLQTSARLGGQELRNWSTANKSSTVDAWVDGATNVRHYLKTAFGLLYALDRDRVVPSYRYLRVAPWANDIGAVPDLNLVAAVNHASLEISTPLGRMEKALQSKSMADLCAPGLTAEDPWLALALDVAGAMRTAHQRCDKLIGGMLQCVAQTQEVQPFVAALGSHRAPAIGAAQEAFMALSETVALLEMHVAEARNASVALQVGW